VNNPEDENSGTREVTFGREVYIERSDFMIDPPKKFFRLGPGLSTRLKDAYKVTCDDYKVDEESGKVTEIYCTYHANSKSGTEDTSGVKVRSTIHWVEINSALDMEIRLYDRLFMDEAPGNHKDRDFLEFLNPDSLNKVSAKAEASLKNAEAESHYQFMRLGYFCPDPDSKADHLVFNRTVTLKDAWKKIQEK
jgi:glutaminyl-tRNA synthetase